MDIDKLDTLIRKFFDYKVCDFTYSYKDMRLKFTLYESFRVSCSLDERYNTFGAGILIAGDNERVLTTFLNEKLSLNSDEKSIRKSLDIIDNYCRLRLPDKFLEAFEEAYNK